MEPTAADRAAFREHAGALFAASAAEIAAIADPGTREIEAAALVPDALLDGPDAFVSEAVEVIAATPYGSDLLAAMAVSAQTPIAVKARVRLDELDEPRPGLGRLEIAEARVMEADDEPVSAVFLLCRREHDDGEQLFSFTIDEELGDGAVKDGFATGTSEGRRYLTQIEGSLPEGVELSPLTPEEGFERILEAAEIGAGGGLLPDPDALTALTVFFRASGYEHADALVQLLELGSPYDEWDDDDFPVDTSAESERFAAEVYGWLRGRGHDPERSEEGRFAAGVMADFQLVIRESGPADWDADVLDEFLLDWVPRKLVIPAAERALLVPSVVDVLTFLGATDVLSELEAAALVKRARGHEQLVLERMSDPAARGPSAVLLDAMIADGIELGDHDAVQAWMEAFNARPFDERDELLGPSLAPWPSTPPPSSGARPKKQKARKAQRQARRRNR